MLCFWLHFFAATQTRNAASLHLTSDPIKLYLLGGGPIPASFGDPLRSMERFCPLPCCCPCQPASLRAARIRSLRGSLSSVFHNLFEFGQYLSFLYLSFLPCKMGLQLGLNEIISTDAYRRLRNAKNLAADFVYLFIYF